VLLYIDNPFGNMLDFFRGADCGIGSLGVGLILLKGEQIALSGGKMVPAIRKALLVEEFSSLVLDLVRISMECELDIEIPIRLNDLLVPFLELSAEMKDFSKLSFSECLFSNLAIDHEIKPANLPQFLGCYIDEIEGRSSANDFHRECSIRIASSAGSRMHRTQRPQSSLQIYLRAPEFS